MGSQDRGYAALSERVKAVEDDVQEVKSDVKDIKNDLKKVLEYMSKEEGARAERMKHEEKLEKATNVYREETRFRTDLTWTKISVLAMMIGAVTGAIALFPHFVLHIY